MNLSEEEILKRFQNDPVFHVVEAQGVQSLEPHQIKILESVARFERTVVSSCHAMGKTFSASKGVLWFTSSFPSSKTITTAPTFKQVKMLLWSEIKTGFQKAKFPFGGAITDTAWRIADDWFAIGFTSKPEAGSKEEQGAASSFQGFHAPFILVVFDEATGIPKSIWTQMEGLMTSGHVRFLGLGNPTTKSCEFFRCFSDPAYNKIYLSCFDSPNFPANGLFNKADLRRELNRMKELPQKEQLKQMESYKVVNKNLITVRWVMRMVLRWGMDHPLVMSKCFGEFPDDDIESLISLGVVQLAQFRSCPPKETDRVSIGVDVARFGTDKSSIHIIQGSQLLKRINLMKRDTEVVAGAVIQEIKSLSKQCIDIHVAVDGTGIGAGVIDNLNRAKREGTLPLYVEIRECNFGASPGGRPGTSLEKELKEKYSNLKARIFVELLEDLKTDLCLLSDDIYGEELPTIHYYFDSKGRWVIESKEDYQKRTGRSSPDDSDSLALANYARKDESGIGTFTNDLRQTNNATMIKYIQGAGTEW